MASDKNPSAATGQHPPGRLFIDVTRTLDSGLHTGIQRVVRGLVRGASAASGSHGIRVHAVRYAGTQWFDIGTLPSHPLEASGACAAPPGPERELSLRLQPRPGDVLLLADASWYGQPWPAVDALLRAGGRLTGFVHDLLPLRHPQWFPPGVGQRFARHFRALLARSSLLFTASEHVRSQVQAQSASHLPLVCTPLSGVLPAAGGAVPLALSRDRPWFLCVATLEPRKQHHQLLDAMETYWRDGGRAGLLLVGASGWRNDTVLERVRTHPEQGGRLYWLRGVSDAELSALYREALAMVYLSRDEGFGLPVLEAREAGCPVIASDIAPLREAGGDWPRYVDSSCPQRLCAALRQATPATPRKAGCRVRTWEAVASDLIHALESMTENPCQQGVIAR
ncbi:glycosyltransferase family 4 protein [Chromatocurvus halotolerans]|uniref:Glycosyltransferase involved in cell wall biosynthesis n=1 Tax=Chromatocurvus halotolerans TaxID=1132028 RepID=A0A4R2KMH9_9GAMM|nr:glycosyltransferase family 1 protein [Chromatocurvus halotolerans]TCO73757.1 glycosyltransferase involved in cell wall biosynthesis [Chromatocurvus halotolerans]